ncbi:CAP domain-containing protein [Streptomyces sp. NPDC056061]|uniref:CAP domain-containing protein n=1 Tax=Streptomyces sp. NPDC056061 TaxID=3345700 RepID=UPI0035D5A28C
MGRHSRSAVIPPVPGRAAEDTDRHRRARHGKRSGAPVRTGLIGASAALAVGAVAVASGLVPGGDTYSIGGGSPADRVRTGAGPDLPDGDEPTASPTGRSTTAADRGTGRTDGPTKAGTPSGSPSSAAPSRASAPAGRRAESSRSSASAASSADGKSSDPTASGKSAAGSHTSGSSAPAARRSMASPAVTSAREAVLALVNRERAKAGCSPVRADSPLASLAQDFSADMAARGFFDHTDPDGRTPWDRASKAGVRGLGGENIARGQADAAAVMDAWMHSDGHRANILNCDFRTLGVGVHFGPGGPWWTQDFGH